MDCLDALALPPLPLLLLGTWPPVLGRPTSPAPSCGCRSHSAAIPCDRAGRRFPYLKCLWERLGFVQVWERVWDLAEVAPSSRPSTSRSLPERTWTAPHCPGRSQSGPHGLLSGPTNVRRTFRTISWRPLFGLLDVRYRPVSSVLAQACLCHCCPGQAFPSA